MKDVRLHHEADMQTIHKLRCARFPVAGFAEKETTLAVCGLLKRARSRLRQGLLQVSDLLVDPDDLVFYSNIAKDIESMLYLSQEDLTDKVRPVPVS